MRDCVERGRTCCRASSVSKRGLTSPNELLVRSLVLGLTYDYCIAIFELFVFSLLYLAYLFLLHVHVFLNRAVESHDRHWTWRLWKLTVGLVIFISGSMHWMWHNIIFLGERVRRTQGLYLTTHLEGPTLWHLLNYTSPLMPGVPTLLLPNWTVTPTDFILVRWGSSSENVAYIYI